MKVTIQKNKPSIEIYPNPVTDHLLNIRFTAMVKGIYRIRLVNTIGQPVFTQQLQYTGYPAPQAMPDRWRIVLLLIVAVAYGIIKYYGGKKTS